MANLSIRNLDDHIHAALRIKAARKGLSVEEFVRRALGVVAEDDSEPDAGASRRASALAAMRAELQKLVPPDRSIVDEFLAERRSMWGED